MAHQYNDKMIQDLLNLQPNLDDDKEEEDKLKRFLDAIGQPQSDPVSYEQGEDILAAQPAAQPPNPSVQPQQGDISSFDSTFVEELKNRTLGDPGSVHDELEKEKERIKGLPKISHEEKNFLIAQAEQAYSQKSLKESADRQQANFIRQNADLLELNGLTDEQKQQILQMRATKAPTISFGQSQPSPSTAAQPTQSQGQSTKVAARTTSRPGANLGVYRDIIADANKTKDQLSATPELLRQSYEQEEQLLAAQRDRQIKQAELEAAMLEDAHAVAQTHAKELQAKERERQFVTDSFMKEYEAELEAFQRMKPQEVGIGKQLGLAIAAALSSLASGIQGKDPMAGMKMLENFQRQRMAKYQTQLGKQRTVINDKSNLLARYQEKFGKDKAALQATHAAEWADIERELQIQQKRYAGTAYEAEYQQLMNQVKQRRLQEEMNLRNQASDLALKAQKQADQVSYQNQLLGMERKKLSSKGYGKQINEGTVLKLADQKAMHKQIADLEAAFKEKTGPFSVLNQFIPGTSANEYNRQADLLRDTVIRLRSGAAITQSEMERMLELIPTASTFDSKGMAAFDAFKNELMNSYNQRVSMLKETKYDISGIQPILDIR